MLPDEVRRRRAIGLGILSLVIAFFVLTAAFAVYFVSQIEPVKKKYIYPYPYQELVTSYSAANGLDPSLVASVIMHESRFQEDARSDRGAVGLMQLMPDTAEWIAGKLGEDFSEERLQEPETNIKYGTWCLAFLMEDFGQNAVLALAAYNAGPGSVHGWMDRFGWPPDFSDADAIPYPETRHYVKGVLKDRKNYERLYAP